MSTFDGIVDEFPYIQIDYFRRSLDRHPPVACFLSHVHSDHLQGLESFRAPFIYCSATTRELLLRIEKYPHRMNFNNGVLESRRLHYKHLYKLLRPIPLNTPTEIELTPRLSIRVTLLDANHCAGAVMFLIEGDGKAILYTGDIRAEPWWVNSLVRHPVLIPYTLGNKRLDKLYLDTTYARTSDIYREFPSKAEGLAELLRKIESYPADTVFYFRAWTFGYEDVWVALSAALNTKVHVDRYQTGLYRSLSEHVRGTGNDGAALCGFELGNGFVQGCLSNVETSRVHSCEPGTRCVTMKSDKIVFIFPIINRLDGGFEVLEGEAGGGGGDLYQMHELELPDQSALKGLERLCYECVRDGEALSRIRGALFEAFRSRNRTLSLDNYGVKDDCDIPLETFVSILSRELSGRHAKDGASIPARSQADKPLSNKIHFPYSRHSSYTELRNLVSAFKPKDIFPCTVDPLTWTEDVSMEFLFGDLCSECKFSHDASMRDFQEENNIRARKRARYDGEFSPQSTQQASMADGGQTTVPRTRSSPISLETDSCRSRIHPAHIAQSHGGAGPGSSLPQTTQDENASKQTSAGSPLQIPKLPPATEASKRSNISHAWTFLKTHPETAASAYHIESLPSSFPTTQERATVQSTLSQQDLLQSQSTPASPSTTDPALGFPSQDHEDEDEDETPSFESQHSSGAAESQPPPSSAPSLPQGANGSTCRPRLDRSDSSRRLRREAYRAARADSYEAWSSVGLLSTGNNHTEEEIEL